MRELSSLDQIRDACGGLPGGDEIAAEAAAARQAVLTKPPGSLGRLEEIACFLARWQGRTIPALNRVDVLVFAGAHGVVARGVSAFPGEVTQQMVANFKAGGAAINQLSKAVDARLKIIELEIERPTADFTEGPAMSEAEFVHAVRTGLEAVSDDADLICLGEMGIGNTTSAAALAAALFGGEGDQWVGRGTGVDDEGLKRKAAAVDAALAHHGKALSDPLTALRVVGGRELAAIFGATLGARLRGIPVLIDGFVCTAAVAPLALMNSDGLAHTLAAHVSAEAAHAALLRELRLRPLLDLGMRLGEGSGAAVAVSILHAAVACHAGMATFAEAGVASGE